MAYISAETSSLQELVQQKEHEWREAQELRHKALQSSLKEKERQLNNEKVRFRKLKDDFEYNLKLLEERDQELQRYDALFSQVRNINSSRDSEISDLKIQLDDLRLKLLHEEKAKEELQRHYQQVFNFLNLTRFFNIVPYADCYTLYLSLCCCAIVAQLDTQCKAEF